jgi:glycopeptide antibiotics resistance protein
VGSYEVLIVFSVETIHFVQHALLAVPVFALTMSFGETVGWVTLMGAVDEAYQYFVLYAGNKTVYFDFNDIILNLVGTGIGVLMIYTLSDLKSAPFTAQAHAARRRLRLS